MAKYISSRRPNKSYRKYSASKIHETLNSLQINEGDASHSNI